MDRFFKNEENVETTLKLVDAISQTTEDFFFIWEIKEDINRFFGNVSKKYNLIAEEDGTNSAKAMLDIIYPADRKLVEDDNS